MMDFSGKAALITGAAMGIGAAVAELLAERGAKVALLDRDNAQLEELSARLRAEGSEVEPIVGDLRDLQVLEQAVERAVLAAYGDPPAEPLDPATLALAAHLEPQRRSDAPPPKGVRPV